MSSTNYQNKISKTHTHRYIYIYIYISPTTNCLEDLSKRDYINFNPLINFIFCNQGKQKVLLIWPSPFDDELLICPKTQNPNNTPNPFFLFLALFPPFLNNQTENLPNCEQYNSLPLLKQIFHHTIKTKPAFQNKTQSIFPFVQHFQSNYNKILKLYVK